MRALLALLLLPLLAQETGYKPAAEVKAAFLEMLDRPRVEPDVKVAETRGEPDGLVSERLTIATEKKADGSIERVPVLILRPEAQDRKRPAVIVLHGTGGTKEGQRGWLQHLAKNGMVGVAIDARYHGERVGVKGGAEAYNKAIIRAWQAKPDEPREHPFYYDTVWDLWRLVDYLVTRPDVDASRLGMIGFSMGGIQTWLAASVDDRIKAAVPAISIQSFRWSLEHEQWQGRAKSIALAHDTAAKDLGEAAVNQRVCRELWGKVIPGILGDFDCPSMVRLFAGRALLIVGGEKDPNCPLGGAKIAIASAEEAFKSAGSSDRLKVMIADGVGHSVPPDHQQAARDWFARWLGN
jgi:dienelactone hydrolase